MLLGVLNIVWLGSINASKRFAAEIRSEVLRVGKVPRFQVPLSVCVLEHWLDIGRQTSREVFLEWGQGSNWVFSIDIYEEDELVRRRLRFIPRRLYNLLHCLDSEIPVAGRNSHIRQDDTFIAQMGEQMGQRALLSCSGSDDDYTLTQLGYPPNPFVW